MKKIHLEQNYQLLNELKNSVIIVDFENIIIYSNKEFVNLCNKYKIQLTKPPKFLKVFDQLFDDFDVEYMDFLQDINRVVNLQKDEYSCIGYNTSSGYLAAYNIHIKSMETAYRNSLIIVITKREYNPDEFENSSESKLLFEKNNDLACFINSDGYIVKTNLAWGRLLDWDSSELINEKFINYVDSNDKQRTEKSLKDALNGHQVNNFENRCRQKDNNKRWFRWKFIPTPKKNIIYACGHDIKKEKEIQLELIQTQKMEAIGTLAGGIAHDFNNILGSIIGYVDLYKMEKDPEVKDVFVDHILAAAKRASGVTNQILNFSRKKEYEQKHVNLSKVLEEVIDLLKVTIPSSVEFVCTLKDKTGLVLGDATQLHQIIMNICTNAYQSLPSNYGKIEIFLKKVNLGQDDTNVDYLELSVSDNGTGIPDKIKDKIFDPFFTTKANGTGLGLSLVNEIIKNYGGEIKITDNEPNGTIFKVYIPSVGVESKSVSIANKENIMDKKTVVLIDDEPSMLKLLEKIIKNMGINVKSFQYPIDALDYLRDNPELSDLVITDYNMPSISGSELAKIVKHYNHNLPVLLMTGDSTLTFDSVELDAIIQKPFRPQELADLVNEILAERDEKYKNAV